MNHNERPIGWTTIDEAKRLVAAQVDLNSADMSYVEGPFTWTLSAVPSIKIRRDIRGKYCLATAFLHFMERKSLGYALN